MEKLVKTIAKCMETLTKLWLSSHCTFNIEQIMICSHLTSMNKPVNTDLQTVEGRGVKSRAICLDPYLI